MKPITHIPVQFSVWIEEDSFDVHVRFTGFRSEEEAGMFAHEVVEEPMAPFNASMTMH